MTILESMCMILFLVVRNFLQGQTMFIRLFLTMPLFLVILPYVTLMNTSHNKYRIIESGWKNVIKNSIGGSNNSVIKYDNDSEGKTAVRNKATKKSIRSKVETISMKEVNMSQRPEDNLEHNDIFIISKFSNNHLVKETNDDIQLHTPVDLEPSTSDGLAGGLFIRRSCSTGDKNDLSKIQDIQDIDKTQILTLIDLNRLGNEKLYLECFRNLIEMKTELGYGEYKLNCTDKQHSDENLSSTSYQTLETCDKRNFRMVSIKASNNSRSCNRLEERLHEETNYTITKLKGQASERSTSRKELLDQFESCYDNYEAFNVLFERLIELEESFIV